MPTTHAAVQARYAARQLAADPEGYRARRAAIRRAWQARNPDKHRAHAAVAYAISKGRLVRPTTCERCGTGCKPEASHDDYAQPLVVEWLCRSCHAAKDRRN